jgi:hypothetical protein
MKRYIAVVVMLVLLAGCSEESGPDIPTPSPTHVLTPIQLDCKDEKFQEQIMEMSNGEVRVIHRPIARARSESILRCEGIATLSVYPGRATIIYFYQVNRNGDVSIGYELEPR